MMLQGLTTETPLTSAKKPLGEGRHLGPHADSVVVVEGSGRRLCPTTKLRTVPQSPDLAIGLIGIRFRFRPAYRASERASSAA
jgi:hypothetical protein